MARYHVRTMDGRTVSEWDSFLSAVIRAQEEAADNNVKMKVVDTEDGSESVYDPV